MAEAIHVPRINNDDEVKLVGLNVEIGSQVTKGQVVAQVETDKAVMDVEAGADGVVLAILGEMDGLVKVGDVLIWLGQTRDAAVPNPGVVENRSASLGATSTAKARALLHEYGLDPTVVPSSGERLSVADIERYLVVSRQAVKSHTGPSQAAERMPEMPGALKALKSEDRGMLATVLWHRDVAVPGYVELNYDPASWDGYALEFGRRHGMMLSPLLPLMAWRLVELARDNPRLNATIVGPHRYEYKEVNLGSTAQVGEVLYLAVVRDAVRLGELGFVRAMVDVQRRAASHKLGAQETQGTTIGFSSMARWKVARHIPILSPQTALMVAHTVGADGVGVLGATYDHRVMSGSDAASTLRKLTKPGQGHG